MLLYRPRRELVMDNNSAVNLKEAVEKVVDSNPAVNRTSPPSEAF